MLTTSAPTAKSPNTADPARRHHKDRSWILTGVVTSVVAVAVLGLFFGIQALSAQFDNSVQRPSEIERVLPPPGSAILRQDSVGLALTPTWYCNLRIDGVRVPEAQLSGAKPLGECLFRPGENRIIEEFRPGPHQVSAEIFPLTDPQSIRHFNWTFAVT